MTGRIQNEGAFNLKAPFRVAIYARVSTRDKGQDTENQLIQLRQFVASNQNWTLAHEYVDCVTGKHADREQFQRLFQDASQRKFDSVLFWSLDRFSRNGVRETVNHLERLTSYGVVGGAVPQVTDSTLRSAMLGDVPLFSSWDTPRSLMAVAILL